MDACDGLLGLSKRNRIVMRGDEFGIEVLEVFGLLGKPRRYWISAQNDLMVIFWRTTPRLTKWWSQFAPRTSSLATTMQGDLGGIFVTDLVLKLGTFLKS